MILPSSISLRWSQEYYEKIRTGLPSSLCPQPGHCLDPHIWCSSSLASIRSELLMEPTVVLCIALFTYEKIYLLSLKLKSSMNFLSLYGRPLLISQLWCLYKRNQKHDWDLWIATKGKEKNKTNRCVFIGMTLKQKLRTLAGFQRCIQNENSLKLIPAQTAKQTWPMKKLLDRITKHKDWRHVLKHVSISTRQQLQFWSRNSAEASQTRNMPRVAKMSISAREKLISRRRGEERRREYEKE